MDAEALILAVLDAVPNHEIQGRKRLQKMSYFAVQTGTEANVRFFLHDFGPFSADVANAADLLAFLGDLEEQDVALGPTKRYSKRYRLADPQSVPARLPRESAEALRALNEFSTIELEIASTIFYFMSQRMNEPQAVEATKKLKPSKSQPKIISRAKDALAKVGLDEIGRAN